MPREQARKSIKDKLFDKALERFRITEWDKSAQEAMRSSLEASQGPVDKDRLKVFVTAAYKPATRGILALAKSLHQGQPRLRSATHVVLRLSKVCPHCSGTDSCAALRGNLVTFFVELVDTVGLILKDVAATEAEIRALFEYLPQLSQATRNVSNAIVQPGPTTPQRETQPFCSSQACDASNPVEWARYVSSMEEMLLEIHPVVYGKKEKKDASLGLSNMMGLATGSTRPPPPATAPPSEGQ